MGTWDDGYGIGTGAHGLVWRGLTHTVYDSESTRKEQTLKSCSAVMNEVIFMINKINPYL